ncbi:hypothetical protein ABIE08_004099 [Kaistia defluvii]|uniref:RiPP n=1 Tax=Kaistia defluvii TaxID=410841 RepID=A0ABV2R4B9_9HYPH
MKKTYEKPAIMKSALLQRVAAEPVPSGYNGN